MANPRKFSEKIALHNQKQAEETAAFEQIMREVIGATRQGPSTYQKSPHHLHIAPNGSAYRAGSLPNVNQIGSNHSDKSAIDLQAALNNLEEMKQGRDQIYDRRHFDQKSMDCNSYSITYLSPPPDTNWRRTNSDSALHQSSMMSSQQMDVFGSASSPRRSTLHNVDNMMIDDNLGDSWDPGKNGNRQTGMMLSASLPDDSRPKSCEVPGITIYPTQEDLNTVHHHIPISTNTGSLPDLTNLHFPAPLSTPIDIDDQSMHQAGSPYNTCPGSPYNTAPGSPYTTGPSSPYSPQSPSNNANLSPPSSIGVHSTQTVQMLQHRSGNGFVNAGNGIITNTTTANQQQVNHRQSSPGPSPSPTSSRRRPHHQLNNLVIGNPRHHHSGAPLSPLHQQSQQQQGLAIDTSALTIDGNAQYSSSPSSHQPFGFTANTQQQYHSNLQGQNYVPQAQSPLQQVSSQLLMDEQIAARLDNMSIGHNLTGYSFLGQMSMGLHRSTTPSDHSCSAPTSPVSHSISPICSPGLPSNNLSKSPFTDNSYFNVQQTNVLQHQLEQIRVVGDFQTESTDNFLMMPGNGNVHSSSSSASSSTGALYMSANALSSPRGSLSDPANVNDFSLATNQTLAHTSSMDIQQSSGPSVYYTSSQASRGTSIQSPTLAYSKSVISTSAYQQAVNTQPQTPQTPTSIPDIILTGPNVDDSILRSHQDFAKDIGTAMASMSGSFDTSDLFPGEEALRAGLDPIDFDGLQMLPDIDTSNDESFRIERS